MWRKYPILRGASKRLQGAQESGAELAPVGDTAGEESHCLESSKVADGRELAVDEVTCRTAAISVIGAGTADVGRGPGGALISLHTRIHIEREGVGQGLFRLHNAVAAGRSVAARNLPLGGGIAGQGADIDCIGSGESSVDGSVAGVQGAKDCPSARLREGCGLNIGCADVNGLANVWSCSSRIALQEVSLQVATWRSKGKPVQGLAPFCSTLPGMPLASSVVRNCPVTAVTPSQDALLE